MVDKITLASITNLSACTDLNAEDCKPLSLPKKHTPQKTRPVQRTVFQIGSEWASPSTDAVLDAFHLSIPAEIPQNSPEDKSLIFSRASGSVEVDAEMADFFAESFDKAATQKDTRLPILQCNSCNRPMIFTRALSHTASCQRSNIGAASLHDRVPSGTTPVSEDEQQELIYAPYSSLTQEPTKGRESTSSARTNAARFSSTSHREKESVRASLKLRKASFPREEDDWETALSPIAEPHIPRCSISRRRRVLLPPPNDSQRKRHNIEKKAISAASNAGLYPSSSPRQSNGNISKPPDPLRETARKMAAHAPWAKLMQIALPLRPKQTPMKRKFPLAVNTISLDTDESSSHIANANGNVKATKASDNIERYPGGNQQQQSPSLIGALLWLRGHATREVSGTIMQHMDIPPSLHGRVPSVFHGQTFSTRIGPFETDPRLPSIIKLPLGVATKPKSTGPGVPSALRPPLATAVDNRQKPAPQKSAAPQANGGLQPRKKPRVSKQPQNPVGGNPPTFVTPAQQGQALARNGTARPNARTPTSMNPVQIPPVLSRQILQHRQLPQVAANAAINSVVGSAALAATNYAKMHQSSQKKVYITPAPTQLAGIHPRTAGAPGIQPTHLPPPVGPGPTQGTKSTGSRGSKPRVGAAHQVSNASPGMRGTGAIPIRNQSPSQGSSHNTERASHLRVPQATAARQFDPGLLASAGQQIPRGHLRHPVYNTAPGELHHQFHHLLAQIAQGGNQLLQDDASNMARCVPTPIQTDVSQANRRTMQGMSPMNRVKPSGSVQSTPQVPQVNDPALLKANLTPRMQVRKDDQSMSHRSAELEQQLRRDHNFMLDGAGVAAKYEAALNSVYGRKGNNPQLGIPNMSQGLYDPTIAATASNQLAPNAIAMKRQQELAFLRMAQSTMAGAQANPNMIQNMRDLPGMSRLPILGIPGQSPNNSVMNFMPSAAPNAGLQNSALSNPMAANVAGNILGQGQNLSMLSGNPILQQAFGTKTTGMNLNNSVHPQQMVDANAQLNSIISGGRGVRVAPNPNPQLSPQAQLELHDLIRGITEEKDLHDASF
ncbi:hypothetical protein BWQ96_00970 [Gracilariopsis chorda]|uniref:Uncharacterized protein n=1 Tax=Gracilariopsis chorda TaxID=448386 RepID=A0A2V3J404_9FLOR|nr:hypothetical protein BWQ96_00970 [Gracilariopsis chorda]|eukprot:PXF49181.1 hypothetical protein BWQ96_00970 [Gracilariopsis chorda]